MMRIFEITGDLVEAPESAADAARVAREKIVAADRKKSVAAQDYQDKMQAANTASANAKAKLRDAS